MKARIWLATLVVSLSVYGASAEVCDKSGGSNWLPAPQNFSDALKGMALSPWTFLLLTILYLAWRANGRWIGVILGLAALSTVLNGLFTWALIHEYRAPDPVLRSALLEGCRSQFGDFIDQVGLWLFTAALAWIGLKPAIRGGRSHGASQS
ncbi:MAG: hypothetical protein LCH39_07905 [Proteobacteria bacterium]|nr:hypothetical protein [Pseudomonadota bacterium]